MITRRKLLLLIPATAVAWKYVKAGLPESAPAYKRDQHWWGMLLDIDKCIGCGSCVRACANENDVPEGYFRTWVERYHVSGWDQEAPQVDSPNGGKNGFPPGEAQGGRTSLSPRCATTAWIRPARRSARWAPPFVTPDGVVLVDEKYCLGCRYCVQACPYGCRFCIPRGTRRRSARCVTTASRKV